jgi:hypothetical protein
MYILCKHAIKLLEFSRGMARNDELAQAQGSSVRQAVSMTSAMALKGIHLNRLRPLMFHLYPLITFNLALHLGHLDLDHGLKSQNHPTVLSCRSDYPQEINNSSRCSNASERLIATAITE